jgi:hypothetical protein
MSGTSVLRGRDQESFLAIDLTGSTGRSLTIVEAAAKIVRLTGTLGQSVTLRLPLSNTENRGYTGVFENATSGGFTVTVAPVTGTGVDVPAGSAVTCFYDGVRMTGQASAAATGLPATIGSAVTFVPIAITNPSVGDTIAYNGTAFANVAAGTATMAVGSAVATGTVGSVLFVGAGPVLAQDNANFFWHDANNFLGLGTNAPQGRLHVKDPTTFSSVFFELGDDAIQAAVRIYPGIAASGGNTLVESGGLILRAHYWNGAASVPVDTGWVAHVTATTPTYYLAGQVGGVDRIHIRQDGQTTLGSSVPLANPSFSQAVVLLGNVFLNSILTIGDTMNVVLGTTTGTKWGTAANQLQGWYGATPVAQQAAPVGTDSQKIAGVITALQAYGLLGP